MKTRIFLVDDHAIVRRGIVELLTQEKDFEVIGEASSARDALDALHADPPDVAIVDLGLLDSSGLQLIKDIKNQLPRVMTVVLSMQDEKIYAERALRAGARGYVPKEEGPEQLVHAIRHVLRGGIFVRDNIAAQMLRGVVNGKEVKSDSPVESLSDRQLEIFELIGSGIGTREVAQRLHLSVKTVESHRENIKQKLGLASGEELTAHAARWVARNIPD